MAMTVARGVHGKSALLGQRLEHGTWPYRQMPEPRPNGSEDRVGDGRGDNGCRRFTETDRNLAAIDKLDVELRHVANAQRRIGIKVRIFHLAFDELGPLKEGQAQAP